ncbi:hypothetical protein [Cardinium endosymbiont of Tipula unca]
MLLATSRNRIYFRRRSIQMMFPWQYILLSGILPIIRAFRKK